MHCSSRRCGGGGLEDIAGSHAACSFPPLFPSQGSRGIFASSSFPPVPRLLLLPHPLSLGSLVSPSGRREEAMPYLYQNSKPRLPMLPGAARATHSSGKTYEELKQECLHRGVLFEDPDFPACNSSLFFSEKPPVPFIWKRPGVSMRLCSLLASCQKSDTTVLWGRTKHAMCSERCRDKVRGKTLPVPGAAAQGWDASHKELRLWDGGLEGLTPFFRCSLLYSHTSCMCIYVDARSVFPLTSLLNKNNVKMKKRGRSRNSR